jgi:uncharacterized protein DUF4296
MKKGLLFVLSISVFLACSSGDNKIPKDVLPVNKMKLIIWDLTQAGAYANFLEDKDTSSKRLNTMYMAEVLKMYNISKEDFFKSFKFYQSDPSLNKVLFDSVSAYAQRQRAEMYKRHQ